MILYFCKSFKKKKQNYQMVVANWIILGDVLLFISNSLLFFNIIFLINSNYDNTYFFVKKIDRYRFSTINFGTDTRRTVFIKNRYRVWYEIYNFAHDTTKPLPPRHHQTIIVTLPSQPSKPSQASILSHQAHGLLF